MNILLTRFLVPHKKYEELKDKKKLIILGSGWASLNVLKTVNPNLWEEIVIISPTNYFLFTPLLPSAVVGTVTESSIVEPVRNHIDPNSNIKFYEANCISIDPKNNKIICQDDSTVTGSTPIFELNYDYLVLAVGSITNTFNTPGVEENCFFVKKISDAPKLKNHILDCFETASLPGVTDEDKNRLLHFVVVGGGPTGVEFAAELNDFIQEDLRYIYKNLGHHTKITLVHSNDHLLNTYSNIISLATDNSFQKQKINTLYNSRVTGVTKDTVDVFDKDKKLSITYPSATCVWATGISQTPVVKDLINSLPEFQKNTVAITTNDRLQVKGN